MAAPIRVSRVAESKTESTALRSGRAAACGPKSNSTANVATTRTAHADQINLRITRCRAPSGHQATRKTTAPIRRASAAKAINPAAP
ncbi:MAG: hypothetical protein ACRDTG_25760 [Pseudonocardiaceae bacterium]